jgi:CAAX protease family protein
MTARPADRQLSPAAHWQGRVFAFARVLIFAIAFVAASYGANLALAGLQKHIATLGGHILLSMSANGVAVMILIAIMAAVSGRAFSSYGYTGPNRFRNFLVGIVCAIALLAAQLLVEATFGSFSFGHMPTSAAPFLPYGLFYALLFLVVALTEENLFRGYGLVELSRAISFWPAAILCSVLFGLPHWLKGEGETIIGGIQAALFSLALAYAFRRTGSLWFGIGVHAGWDYGESFIFGVPNSALKLEGSILHPVSVGPDWLSGGTVGPEGSLLVLLPILGLVLVAWQLGRNDRPTLQQPVSIAAA